MAGETVRAITGSSGRSSAAAMVTARFDLVVVGQGEHALAVRVVEPGDREVLRVAGVAGQPGHVGVVGDQIQGVDAFARLGR